MNKNSVKLDYSNTIVYKIYCKNPEIKQVYIGHTVNFINRMTSHKTCCNSNSNKKLYQFMRNNGGWDNWEMDEIAKYNCKNKCEALAYEQYHYEQFADTLNVKRTVVNKLHCANCVDFYKSNKLSLINVPTNNARANNVPLNNDNILTYLYDNEYICELCKYKTHSKKDGIKHIATTKHKNKFQNNLSNSKYICICGKLYTHQPSLCKHKRTCTQINKVEINNVGLLEELNTLLKKQQSDIKLLVDEQNKTIQKIQNITRLILEKQS